MFQVVDRVSEVLATTPDPVLPLGKIGIKQPIGNGDLPAIVISLQVDDQARSGFGSFLREANVPTKNTALVEVAESVDTFSPGLQILRLTPLPLRKDPASVSPEFTSADVHIRNVTDMAHPVEYRLVEAPVQLDEYTIDAVRTELKFGQPQIAGNQLEVTHWTTIWHEDVRMMRYSGTLFLEVWATSPTDVSATSLKLQTRFFSSTRTLRQKGLLKLLPAALAPVVTHLFEPVTGSPFAVSTQKLAYHFTFEGEEGGEASSGAPIRLIDVRREDPASETFLIHR